jgi:hypothetical protein
MEQIVTDIPDASLRNLAGLYLREESLRRKAVGLISVDEKLKLHLFCIEAAMNLADVLRQYETSDEDLKVAQVLGIRMFNSFGAGLKLALSGYSQKCALIMRDVIETVFLLDYFSSDRTLIGRWRHSDKKTRKKEFAPIKVREALDARDGLTGKKRHELYELFSELAGHPNMNSAHMLRPRRGGDIVIGPFIEASTLGPTLFEMGRLALQAGEHLNHFFPADWQHGRASQIAFAEIKLRWFDAFYPNLRATNQKLKSKGD